MGLFDKGMEVAMMHNEEPVWCKQSFSEVLYQGKWKWLAKSGAVPGSKAPPKIRGVMEGSQRLSVEEEAELLEHLQGAWYVASVDCLQQAHHKMVVRGSSYKTQAAAGQRPSSANLNPFQYKRSACLPSSTQEGEAGFRFQFYRGPNGEIYCDRYGTLITAVDEGEIAFNNAFGHEVIWHRSWRKNLFTELQRLEFDEELDGGSNRPAGPLTPLSQLRRRSFEVTRRNSNTSSCGSPLPEQFIPI